MAASDARQRRAFAHTHPQSTATDTPSPEPLASSTSHGSRAQNNVHFAQRAAMRLVQVALLSLAMYVVPVGIQHLVRSLDTLYQAVGRMANTSFDDVTWTRVALGAGVLAAWHVALVALSFSAIAGTGQSNPNKQGTRGSWSHILGRVLVPAYLVVALIVFFYTLATRLAAPVLVPASYVSHASND